ncbi:MAG: tetratricopeptide repeat protein [Bacteroidetes Order II. Incertae sedis bacterium]|nr:tetratricopeptide repeat protein [Bacteroidetes Order II. bacterium]
MSRLERLKMYLAEDPTDAFTQFAIAQEYLKMGDLMAARTQFEALVEGHPGYVGTYYHLGKLYEKFGDREKAEATYKLGTQVADSQSAMHERAELQNALVSLQLNFHDDD